MICPLGPRVSAIALAAATFVAPSLGAAAAQIRGDPQLLAALRAEGRLQACRCLVSAAWIDESYPRITVDAARWNELDGTARKQFAARALEIAEATYLAENAAADQYEQIFIVNRRGKVVFSFHPPPRG